MICFTNPGLIDPRLITTFGANVKEIESPIGYFGTGLKYAIAVLLREGQKIKIKSGPNTFQFAVQTDTIRGKEFSFPSMNGVPLGFTLELGKNWDLRAAYRELYSNCKDEGGQVQTHWSTDPNSTSVCIEGDKFEEVHRRRAEIILEAAGKTLLFTNASIEIYHGRSDMVFYRGIAAYRPGKLTNYTYNILQPMTLTEDRTLASGYSMNHVIAAGLAEAPASVVSDALSDRDSHEFTIDFDFISLSEDFLNAVAALTKTRPLEINRSAVEHYYKSRVTRAEYDEHPLSAEQQLLVQRAAEFVNSIGFPVNRFPIHVVKHLGTGVLAMARSGTIYLTPDCLDWDLLRFALIEETLHLTTGLHDETRNFQNALFSHIVRLGEELITERTKQSWS